MNSRMEDSQFKLPELDTSISLYLYLWLYFMKRYLTSWMSLNYPPRLLRLSPFTFLETLFYQFLSHIFFFSIFSLFLYVQKVLNILLPSLAAIFSPFITKPLRRVVNMLSTLPPHSLNPSVWLLSPSPYWKYAFENHWGHLIGKPSAFFSMLLLMTSLQWHCCPPPTPPPGNPLLSLLLWWPTVRISSHQHEHSFSVHCMASIPIMAVLPYVLFSPCPVT